MSSNTKKSFKDKWMYNSTCFWGDMLTEGSNTQDWVLKRNGFACLNDFVNFLSKKNRILDAGCGNGRVTALLRKYAPKETEIVGIDFASASIAQANFSGVKNVSFYDKDLLGNLDDLGRFDFIYCQEVLHHTENPYLALSNLFSILDMDGEIATYVYKKKAPVREFVDSYVRDRISNLTYEEARLVNENFTDLGRSLSNASIKIKVPSIPILEIEEGEYDLQRFIYHFFMKCYWNPELSYEENVVINYDWYHPQLCSKHTLEEVCNWYKKLGALVIHDHVDFYGITIRAIKNK